MLSVQPKNDTERLAQLLRSDLARGKVDRKALAAECGVSQQAISGWLDTGRITKSNLAIVAKYTGRPLTEYMGLTDNEPATTDTSALLSRIAVTAREPAAVYNVKPVRERGARPVINWVRAGEFDDIVDPFHPGEADRWEAPMYRSGPRAFWLVVEGDSMTAPPGAPHSFPEGTLIHCDPDIEGVVGRYVIAKDVASQRATFKLLTSDGLMQYLKPLNPAYPTMPINNGHIRIIATVTEWRIGGKL